MAVVTTEKLSRASLYIIYLGW